MILYCDLSCLNVILYWRKQISYIVRVMKQIIFNTNFSIRIRTKFIEKKSQLLTYKTFQKFLSQFYCFNISSSRFLSGELVSFDTKLYKFSYFTTTIWSSLLNGCPYISRMIVIEVYWGFNLNFKPSSYYKEHLKRN